MPLYTLVCPGCAAEYHDELCKMCGSNDPVVLFDGTPAVCECGTPVVRDRRPPVTARTSFGYSAAGNDYGIRDGTVFHSRAERAAYEEKFKIDGMHDAKRGRGLVIADEAQHEADQAAKDQGYKDHRDYRATKKREKQLKRGQLKSFERRVQVGG